MASHHLNSDKSRSKSFSESKQLTHLQPKSIGSDFRAVSLDRATQRLQPFVAPLSSGHTELPQKTRRFSEPTTRITQPGHKPQSGPQITDHTVEVEQLRESVFAKFKPRRAKGKETSPSRKQDKPRSDPDSKTDILLKDRTQKLNKFWAAVETEDAYDHYSHEPEAPVTSTPTLSPSDGGPRYLGTHLSSAHLNAVSEQSIEPSTSSGTSSMDLSRLRPVSGLSDPEDKIKCKRDAKEMYKTVVRHAEKANATVPPYDFLELIGKGSYGRVYKCLDKRNGNLVAIKMINIDAQDLAVPIAARADSIKSLNQEISTMKQLRDNHVKNVLLIHEAFDMGPYVWIVSDYCTGGSVKTLLSAMTLMPHASGLDERHIIPIARELAIAIKGVHEQGLIHRDVKCGNVYVDEHGEIRLGDFGVVGVMDSDSKRQTIIGTPHWLPKEIIEAIATDKPIVAAYGTEVDIWSYGCTLYEMAKGHPPNNDKRADDIALLAALERATPRLEGGTFSQGLRDLVAFCLDENPRTRPKIDAILEHPYLAGTENDYPTSNLIGLIDKFKMWMHGGGSRSSLWIPSEADAGINENEDDAQHDEEENDDWNFSTSDNFDQEFDKRYSLMFEPGADPYTFEAPAGAGLPPLQTQDIPMAERVRREHADLSANRGEQSLGRIFDPSTPAYQLTPEQRSPPSDLPLRTFTADAPSRESVLEIDLNEAGSGGSGLPDFSFNESTIKPAPRSRTFYDDDDTDNDEEHEEEEDDFALGLQDTSDRRDTRDWSFPSHTEAPNRKTMEWTFGSAGQTDLVDVDTLNEFEFDSDISNTSRPSISRTATEPAGHFRGFSYPAQQAPLTAPIGERDSVTSMIDLDLGLADPAEIVRPPTASSTTGSTASYMTSGNPFDLEEDPEQNERDRQRFSYHKQLQSEDASRRRKRRSQKNVPMHARAHSLSSTDSERERRASAANRFGDPFFHHSGSAPYQPQALEQNVEPGSSHPDPSTNQWPSFGSFDQQPSDMSAAGENRGLDGSMFLPPTSGVDPMTNGHSQQSGDESSPAPQIEFPVIEPPNPDALIENADPALLEDEFTRALDSLAAGMDGLAHALRLHFNVSDDDDESDLTSDFDSGFDSV